MNALISIISAIYNEQLESLATRLLYFFNTINTYFIFAGVVAFAAVYPEPVHPLPLFAALLFVALTCRLADFFPYFALTATPVLALLGYAVGLPGPLAWELFLANLAVFVFIQFSFMGIPDSIVARDWRIGGFKIWNSLFTVAPTTVSFTMSVFYSFYLSFGLTVAATAQGDDVWVLAGCALLLLMAAGGTRLALPKNHYSKFHKPDVTGPRFKRLLILNIDGCRKDVFDPLDLPTARFLKENGTSHSQGLSTVYRALTNPAFASIFTGAEPKVHGIRDNNLGQAILTEGLPDIVPSIAYGSMHVKHFCKHYWKTRIVSLPRHSVYQSDDVAVEWMREDILNQPDVRLFVFDFSEADFLGHAYGSTSKQYKAALGRVDARIGGMIEWLKEQGLDEETGIIVCSDHGISQIDHSYLLADSERYVPFYVYGKGVRAGHVIDRPGTIMDICATAAYLLGVRYPVECRGQVFADALEDVDLDAQRKELNNRFNSLKYGVEAGDYRSDHPEVYAGDGPWWGETLAQAAATLGRPPRILDLGCGSGFVAERLLAANVPFDSYLGQDLSPEMVESARGRFTDERISFVTDPDALEGPFDIIAANSVFHHLVDPGELAQRIDGLLAPGGMVMGAHEPNKRPFANPLFRLAAAAYKAVGGGFVLKKEFVEAFNDRLRQEHPNAPLACGEEIQQMVEYHSPVEQYDSGVNPLVGFEPEGFTQEMFPGYEVVMLEDYTTFFHRPWLSRRRWAQKLLEGLYAGLFRQGNLFRFALRKSVAPDP